MRIIFFFLFLFQTTLFAQEPITPLPESVKYNKSKALLGRQLFFEPILSKDQSVSCASCHNLETGGVDLLATSFGIKGQKGAMNAPTVFNSSYNFKQFWNGRSPNLAHQALQPIQNPIEMGLSLEELEARINQHPKYRQAFAQIYGPKKITAAMIGEALAEFEKALVTPNSRFDLYLRGKLKLTKLELNGYNNFKRLGCISCHNGINIGGNSFQKIGIIVPYPWDSQSSDLYQITKKKFDKNRFKVPTLRNIALTPPYFHNGSAKTLQDSVRVMAYFNLGVILSPTEEKSLVAFLKSLTGEIPTIATRP